jgi:hypothetical protein
MTKDVREKIFEAIQLTKDLAEKHERLDQVYVEFATAFACIMRGRRILLAREAEQELEDSLG